MWKHKNCGGKLRVVVSRMESSDFNIDKTGNPTGKCLRKTIGEVEGENFYCTKCGEYYDSYGRDIESIAEWEEK